MLGPKNSAISSLVFVTYIISILVSSGPTTYSDTLSEPLAVDFFFNLIQKMETKDILEIPSFLVHGQFDESVSKAMSESELMFFYVKAVLYVKQRCHNFLCF